VRALVTGAGGFIGGHVVRALVAAGAEVRALDRDPTAADRLPGAAEPILGDVLDPFALRRALQDADAVFHLAAVYSFRRADAALMRLVNVEGTRTLLQEALRGRRRRIVHTSSCATCGPVAGRQATEDDLPSARELRVPYRLTKLQGERLAMAAAREGGDVVVTCPTAPVGPGDRGPTPTGKMVADVARGRARGYLAKSALNVVGVADVAAGHLLAFERGRAGERYLLGGENLAISEVFSIISAAVGRAAPRLPVPWSVACAAAHIAQAALRPLGREPELLLLDEVRSGRLPHLFDDRRARAQLGYSPASARAALQVAALAALEETGPGAGGLT